MHLKRFVKCGPESVNKPLRAKGVFYCAPSLAAEPSSSPQGSGRERSRDTALRCSCLDTPRLHPQSQLRIGPDVAYADRLT